MAPQGQTNVKALITPISGMVGSYTGIAAVGGVFSTSSSKTKVSIVGSMLNITIDAFPSNVCQYSASVNQDGRSLSGETFQCSDFRTGTWSLVDLRSIGGNDLYVSLLENGNLRRAYGIR